MLLKQDMKRRTGEVIEGQGHKVREAGKYLVCDGWGVQVDMEDQSIWQGGKKIGQIGEWIKGGAGREYKYTFVD